jgi:ADP-heptose:LPS heptosyltransferase
MRKVLVIKLGALGDFAQAFGAMATIRGAHPEAELTLLTTPPYAEIARDSGLFDRIETDGRVKTLGDYWRLFRRLRRERYNRVYDLHTSSRTKQYRWFFWPRFPEWSGISTGASHRQTRKDRNALHNLDRLADQLHVAGIAPAYPLGEAPAPDLSWAVKLAGKDVAKRFGLKPPYALLAPGASPTGEAKRWPVERYAALAAVLRGQGVWVAVLGGPTEAAAAEQILAAAPGTVDLTSRTRVVDIAGLAAGAALTVGNDTGPTHWAAYAGSPGLMLMARVSRAGHCEPRARMETLMVDDIKTLGLETVTASLMQQGLIRAPSPA